LALGHRRTALDVELAALQNGVYVGDSYNDRPQSLDELEGARPHHLGSGYLGFSFSFLAL
jgi:hypothetical protein